MLDQKFSLLKIIGQRGSSNLFTAVDEENNQYAIKTIRKDKNYYNKVGAHMIEKEHQILNILEGHPNIIQSPGMNISGELEIDGKIED